MINDIAVASSYVMSVDCSSVEMSLQIVLDRSTEDRSSVGCGGRLFQSRGAELEKARAANADVVNGKRRQFFSFA